MTLAAIESLKQQAGETAAGWAESGMVIGLGTGSTVRHAIAAIGRRLAEGALRDIRGVATSLATERQARELGIPLVDAADLPSIDLCIDGADEVDPNLDLIKGLGGALVREKLVAGSAVRFVVVADAGKRVSALGLRSPLPVAVLPFGWRSHLPFLAELGATVALRVGPDGSPQLSDDGLYHLDCHFPRGIDDPELLEMQLKLRPGIVDSGLFLGLATDAVIADENGVTVLRRP